MRLSIKSTKNETFYYVLSSKRVGDKVVSEVVEKIGRRSDLIKEHKDPEAFARARVAEINASLRESRLTVNSEIDFSEPLEGEGQASESTLLNVGWLYLKRICDEFRLGEFMESIRGKAKYDMPAILTYAVASRVISPGSKLSDWRNRSAYLGGPDYEKHDPYKAVRALGAESEALQRHLFKACKEAGELSAEVLYYDCTNFYFEVEDEDEDLPAEEGDFVQWGLRKYGFSKEHRPNPIVQMGLFVDANGVPVSYCLSPGNTSEQVTAVPLEKRMAADYGQAKFIYCSDGGLGSFENRFFNTLQQRGYIVTQSLRKTAKEEREAMLKDMNWRFVDDDSPASVEEMRGLCDRLAAGEELSEPERRTLARDMIYKEYPMDREIDPSRLAGVKAKGKLCFSETVFVTFSAKYYLYQRDVFSRQLMRAENWVEKGVERRKNPNDPARLVRSVGTTASGEVATKKTLSIDEKRAEEERAFHGFYAVATSLDEGIKEILRINAGRWRIEYQFRVMKSEFDARPVFMSSEEGIKGHFAVCYAAQVVYSVLERRLKKIDKSLTAPAIVRTLRNMNVSKKSLYYEAHYTNSKALSALEKQFGLGLDHHYLSEKTIRKAQ